MQVDPQDLIKRCDIDLAQPLGADETDIAGLFKICLTLALVLAAADPIGALMTCSTIERPSHPLGRPGRAVFIRLAIRTALSDWLAISETSRRERFLAACRNR
jgi:hypothetical protein